MPFWLVYTVYIILEWTTSLDTSSRTLFVRMCVHVTSNVELRNNVRLLLNVELRNITSDCLTSSYVRMLFKYCGIIGLLVNIPITICITVIPPLSYLPPHPPSLPTLPLSPSPSLTPLPPSLPHVPSPPSLRPLPTLSPPSSLPLPSLPPTNSLSFPA